MLASETASGLAGKSFVLGGAAMTRFAQLTGGRSQKNRQGNFAGAFLQLFVLFDCFCFFSSAPIDWLHGEGRGVGKDRDTAMRMPHTKYGNTAAEAP